MNSNIIVSSIKKSLLGDLRSGMVVFLVALPLCLGISLAQGVPLIAGLLSGMVGGILIGMISGSQLSVSGPAAGMTAVVLSATAAMGRFDLFLAALCVAGVVQVLMGVFRLGSIAAYIPQSVLQGMLAAIGLILIIKQLPHLVGYDAEIAHDMGEMESGLSGMWTEMVHTWHASHKGAIIMGILSLLVMFLWPLLSGKKKWLRYLPAPLLVVLLGVLLNYVFLKTGHNFYMTSSHRVNLPDMEGEWYSLLSHPDLSGLSNPLVWKFGLIMALVASLESLLCIEAIDAVDPLKRRTPANRELIAQGVGNLTCGMIGGIPVTSVIVRSSANLHAGAQTKISAISHGLWFIPAVFIFPHIIEVIPIAPLAAILIYTGYKLASPKQLIRFYKQGFDQAVPFLVTIGMMLVFDLLTGVLCGMVVSLLFAVVRLVSRPFVVIQEKIQDKEYFVIQLSETITYFSKPSLHRVLRSIPDNAHVTIEANKVVYFDREILLAINDFISKAEKRNVILDCKIDPEILKI